MPHLARPTAVLLLVGVLTVTGCSGPGDADGGSERAATPASSASSSAPWRVLDGPLVRCGPQPPEVATADLDYQVLRDDVGAIPSVRVGTGPTVAVLLHQTDGNGLCGWLPAAAALARDGVAALAIDLCRYGESACRALDDDTFAPADQVDPVATAVAFARDRMGARRVVVVGASMGGSVALMSAARLRGIDAVADLSGPVDWPGADLVRRGRALQVPVLLAMARSEGSDQVDPASDIVANAPAGSRLVVPDDGHGYALLLDLDGRPLPLADELRAWVVDGPQP